MLNGKKVVALLPMKANSERVRGKNFRDLAGKPLYRWILDSLLALPQIDQVVINTDARSILAESGLVSGGKVLVRDRKPEICGDLVSMNLVLADDIETVESDIYLMTHTTNPLLPASTMGDALGKFAAMLASGSHDSMFSVNKVQTRFYRQDGSAVNHDPANLVRTQDLEPWFEENSNFYLFTRESFRAASARIGKRPAMYDMRRIESVDIDDADDWAVAEALARTIAAGGAA